ncbi:MAG: CHAT domain-containing protein [Chitinophagales bacterium]
MTRTNLFMAYCSLGQIERADKYINDTLELGLNHLEKEDVAMGAIFEKLGWFYAMVHYDAFTALPYFEKALNVFKKLNVLLNISGNLANLGYCCWLKEDYKKAIKYFKEGLSYGEETLEANFIGNIGNCYGRLKDHAREMLFYKRALELRKKKLRDNHPDIAHSYRNIGFCYLDLEQANNAIKPFQKALEILLKNFDEAHREVNLTYQGLGRAFSILGDYPAAIQYHQKASTYQPESVDNNNLLIAANLSSMAFAYEKSNQIDEAIYCYQTAQEHRLNRFGSVHPSVTSNFIALSECYSIKKDYTEAFVYIQKALQSLFHLPISLDVYAPLPSMVSISDWGLLDVLSAKGKHLLTYYKTESNQQKDLQAAFDTYFNIQLLINRIQKSYRTENSNLLFSNRALVVYSKSIETALNMPNQGAFAFTSSEKAKAHLLLSSIQDNKAKIVSTIPDDLLQKEKQLKIELTYLEKSIKKEEAKGDKRNEKLLKNWESEFFNYHQKYIQLLQQLEADYPDYYQLKYNTQTATPTELQSVLAENQVVISYFVGEEKLYIFVVTEDEFEVLDLQLPNDFEVLIEDFIVALTQHQFAVFTEKGGQLNQLLIAPIRDFIVDDFGFDEELKQVFVIPHGVLSYVPFEALIEAKPLSRSATVDNSLNKNSWSGLDYLINHCEISYHYSATLLYRHLIKKKNQEEIPNSFAGFAPIYDTGVPSKSTAANLSASEQTTVLQQSAKEMQTWATRSDAIRSDGTWVSLPHSETEAKGIAQLFEGKGLKSEVFLRNKASKEGFSDAAKRFKFLLVAAHGLVNDEKTALSGLVFYPSEGSENREEGSDRQDEIDDSAFPTYRLSHPTSQTDSVLSMEETHHLDLQADLVVLSSCESGIGTLHKGEGMMAVNRGFLAAGANNVVSTLFKVYDKPSSLLTQYLFEAILKGDSYRTALRKAKLQLLEIEGVSPKSWCGFVLIGG